MRDSLQFESMDSGLRNNLWNALKVVCWDGVYRPSGTYGSSDTDLGAEINRQYKHLCERIWVRYFKDSLETLGTDWDEVLARLRSHFFNEAEWNQVFDFIEFVANNFADNEFRDQFTSFCNKVLEAEMSAYRFVDGVITPITNEIEIDAIESAAHSGFSGVDQHMRLALEKLSNKTKPDYRNSVKESISAVESLARSVLDSDKATLPSLLAKLEEKVGMHPALKKSLAHLYGYTSDEEGVRHAITNSIKVDFDDAKFMLVTCSAFVNYVTGKLESLTNAQKDT